ncbi:MAG: hypothetical protein AAGK37_20765 [Pseudomonadota bacterium]
MRAPAILASLAISVACQVDAGPWAREAGTVFLSFSTELTLDRDDPLVLPQYDATLYGEVGLGNRFALGVDLYQGPESYTYLAFVERALQPGDARHQFALRLGIGTGDNGFGASSLVLVGASWGLGFDSRLGGGWAVVDAQVRSRTDGGQEVKVDATLGIRPWDNWAIIGQLQAADYPQTDPTLRLQTTAVRRLNDRFRVEAGIVYGIENTASTGLKLGIWSEF